MKKILTILGLIALMVAVATGAVLGTLAFLKDTDGEINTMVIGDVEIDLHEGNGQGAVDEAYQQWLAQQKLEPGQTTAKQVWVQNIGMNDAYIRVHVALPATTDGKILTLDTAIPHDATYSTEIDGETYNVYVFVYKNVFAPGESTGLCLLSVSMNRFVDGITNADGTVTYTCDEASYTASDGKIPVLVFAEGGQSGGFDNAVSAMNDMFGVPGTYNPWAPTQPNP